MKIWNEKLSDLSTDKDKTELIPKEEEYSITLISLNSGQLIKKHVHRISSQTFFILNGRVEFTVNDLTYPLEAGQMIYIEAGEIHSIKNICQDAVRVLRTRTRLDICDHTDLD